MQSVQIIHVHHPIIPMLEAVTGPQPASCPCGAPITALIIVDDQPAPVWVCDGGQASFVLDALAPGVRDEMMNRPETLATVDQHRAWMEEVNR